MTAARRKRERLNPSMFPFLAVLLCTMGALVVLLMLVVASAQAAARQTVEQRKFEVDLAESHIHLARDHFERELATGNVKLEKQRLALQHLEAHIQELLDELGQLERTASLLDESSAATDAGAVEVEISQLEQQLADAQSELKTKLEKPDGDKPIFAIIPYDGPSGTHRRPIYLECTAQGLTIQPEGIALTTEDLRPPFGPGNPLDAALRTIRNEFKPDNQAVTSTAYPLLVVRPSGIETYAAARAAMSGWDDQFGYELIDEELELAFPESKPGLGPKIASALELARQRQAALVMAMPRKYRQFAGTADWTSDGDYGRTNTEGYAAQGTNSGSSGQESPLGTSGSSRGGFALSGFDAANGLGPTSTETPLGFAQGDPLAEAGYSGMGQPLAGHASGGQSLLSTAGTPPFATGSSGGSSSGSSSDSNSSRSNSTPAGSTQDGDSSSSHSGPPGGSASAGASRMSAGGQALAIPNMGHFGSGSGDSAQTGSQYSSPANSGAEYSSDPTAAGNPSSMAANRAFQQGTETARPLAAKRGRDWAWSQGPPTQTPVVRSIRIRCEAERWIVLPDASGQGKQETVEFDMSLQQRAERLAQLIHARVESWGLSISGGYWKPILAVEVADDAQWRFDQLERLFEGSGLEMQRRAPAR